MQKEVHHYPVGHFLADFWSFIHPYKIRFIFWSFIRCLASALELLVPIMLGMVIDTLTTSSIDVRLLSGLVIGITIIELVGPTIRLRSKFHLGRLSEQIAKDVRLKGLSKVLELDLSWHEDTMSGAVMDKVSTGAGAVKALIKFLRENGYSIVIRLVGALLVFSYLHTRYLLLLLGAILTYLWVEYHYDLIISRERNKQSMIREQLVGRTYEFAHNIRTVKALGLERTILKRATKAEQRMYTHFMGLSVVMNRKWRIMQTVAAFFKTVFLAAVCFDVLRGNLSAGMVLVYVTYFQQVHGALNDISDSIESLIENKNGVYRLMTILDAHSEVDKGKSLKQLPAIQSLIFHDVSFQYKEKEVMSAVSFSINKGDHIGIIGQSGVGKSTLFKLLLKLYLPTHGDVLINGVPIAQIARRSITEHLTIVPQETEVFNLSFKDNVTLGKVDEKKYRTAIKIAQCVPIISKLPQGDETLIGEKGVRLSGGERQRLGIARALYKEADVLLLDEATSHLDSRTEHQIISQLEKLDKTLIVIAHRLSTLHSMDRIIVFSRGCLVEEGTYSELLAAEGVFYRMHQLQQ
ncbi:ABC transporter ATP-binding protein [Candidatus Woesearchaeota archaeon]|nr:ABC transporter ATP-binding protein [Candidatus Woesearchaeota archaeon]